MAGDKNDKGFLVVHFDDVAYTTISAPMDSTVPQICNIVAKRRNLNPQLVDSFGLFVREQEGDSLLTGGELPLQIQDSLTRKGQIANVKFIFKELDGPTPSAPLPQPEEDSEGSDHDEPSIFGASVSTRDSVFDTNPTLCAGYLEKRGKLNKAFRGRWFVLQAAKLYYFKTRESKIPQSYILLEDVAVREQPQRKLTEYVFELVTTTRIFQMKANTYCEMQTWISAIRANCEVELSNYSMDDIQLWMYEDSFDRANADELAREQVSTLSGCLANHVAQSALMQFAVENHSAENLLFWIEVERYRELFAKKLPGLDMAAVANKLVGEFLVPGARHEISVEGKYRNTMISDIRQGKNIHVDTFKMLQNQAFSHMENTIFPRFQVSKQFNTALVFLNGQSTKDLFLEDVAYKHPPIPIASALSPPMKQKEPKKKGRLSITKAATLTSKDFPLRENASSPSLPSSSSVPNLNKAAAAPPPAYPPSPKTVEKAEDSGGRWKPKTIFDSVEDDGENRSKGVPSMGPVLESPEDELFDMPSSSMPGLTNASAHGRSGPPTSLFDDDDDEIERFRRKDPPSNGHSQGGGGSTKQSRNIHYMVSTPTETNPLLDSMSSPSQNAESLLASAFSFSSSTSPRLKTYSSDPASFSASPPPPTASTPTGTSGCKPPSSSPKPLAASSPLSSSSPALSSMVKKPPPAPPSKSSSFTPFFSPSSSSSPAQPRSPPSPTAKQRVQSPSPRHGASPNSFPPNAPTTPRTTAPAPPPRHPSSSAITPMPPKQKKSGNAKWVDEDD